MIEAAKKFVTKINVAYKKYTMNLEEFFEKVYSIMDIPNISLFEALESLKKNGISQCDPKMISIIIEQRLSTHFDTVECFKCGKKAHFNKTTNINITTTFGNISFKSPYYSCSKCSISFNPYAKVLGLRDGKYQYDFQKVVSKISSSIPFAETAEILNDIYGTNISTDAVHQMTSEFGEHVSIEEVVPTAKVVQDIIDEISFGKSRRPVLVVTADGAMAPIRTEKGLPQCWKENKGVRFYLLDGKQIVHLLSWHQIYTKKDFIKSLQTIKDLGLFSEESVRVCCLGDGAAWIWEGMSTVFPDARQVLDYYHCSEHLHAFAKVKFSDTPKRDQWVKQTKARLFENKGRAVLAGLKRMKVEGDAKDARDNLYNYLLKNIDRIDYRKAKKGGYPIGSGPIESANKFIGHVRLKRSGAWWKVDHANEILKLRCSRYNGTFDRIFQKHENENNERIIPGKPNLTLVK